MGLWYKPCLKPTGEAKSTWEQPYKRGNPALPQRAKAVPSSLHAEAGNLRRNRAIFLGK